MRRPGIRRKKAAWALLIPAFIAAFTVWYRATLPPRLLKIAARVASTVSWKLPYYQWISNEKVLYLNDDLAPKMTGAYTVRVLDTKTGASESPAALNKSLRDPAPLLLYSIIGGCGWMQVSPDGKQLLWVRDPVPHPYWNWFSCNLDGSQRRVNLGNTDHYQISPTRPVTRWVWTRDSRQWAALTVKDGALHAFLYDIGSTRIARDVTLDIPKSMVDPNMAYPLNCLGFTFDNQLLATTWYPEYTNYSNSSSVDLFSFDLTGSRRSVRKTKVSLPLPSASTIREVVVSPQGDRIAWNLVCDRIPGLQYWLGGWLPFFRRPPEDTSEIWTSRIDGSDLRMVGYEPCDRIVSPANAHAVHFLRWTPDGRRLSFCYDGSLYVVPVP